MNIEKNIMDGIRRLPAEKRRTVLAFVESIQETEAAPDEEIVLSADEQVSHWNDWVQNGPKGPLDEDTHPEFP